MLHSALLNRDTQHKAAGLERLTRWPGRVIYYAKAALFTFLLFAASSLWASQAVYAPRTSQDIIKQLKQAQPDPKRAAELQTILNDPAPQNAERNELAMHYLSKALAAKEVGDARRRLDNYRKVIELGGARNRPFELRWLARSEMDAGSALNAVEIIKSAMSELPPANGQRLNLSTLQAEAYVLLADFDNAERMLKAADGLYRAYNAYSWFPAYRYTYSSQIHWTRAQLLSAQGKFVEAEAEMRRAIAHRYEDIKTIPLKTNRAEDFEYEWAANVYQADLAKILAHQGRLGEAEVIVRQALQETIPRFGGYSYQTAKVLLPFVEVLLQQGRYAEAEQLGAMDLEILARIGSGDDSNMMLEARYIYAASLVAQGRYQRALGEYRKIQAAYAKDLDTQSRMAGKDLNWMLTLVKAGQADEALALLDEAIARSAQWLGREHGDTLTLGALKGMALAAANQKPAALAQFNPLLPGLLHELQSQSDAASPLRAQRLRIVLETYLQLLGEVYATPLEQAAGIDAAGEAFRIADALRGQSTQQAVSASAARSMAGDPQLGAVIRKEQDLRHEATALQQILRDLMAASAKQQLPTVIADMQKRINVIRKEQNDLQADIAARFPAYANLIHPQPPSITQARAALKRGEALLTVFVNERNSFVWAFKQDGPLAFAATPVTRAELERTVQTLRGAVDPPTFDVAKLPRFDVTLAHSLYAALLAPVAAGWQGADSLLVTANGALSQLPFALLPTSPGAPKADASLAYAEFKAVPWLIRQLAVTQLPSVNALVSLRRLPKANPQRAPFIGFGDPEFALAQQAGSTARRVRNLALPRAGLRNANSAEPGDWLRYSQIPPLPDTRDEILALAKALQANPEQDIFLGKRASKQQVMAAPLSKYRIVAFATHGLLPGEFPGVDQPSLALANPNDGNHGLLTLEEILKLKLDADWVILSACNTAAGDGAGSDAVSGLGRGFFYAGTRSLLATHWPVESVSARLLVTGIFERQAANPAIHRAEALRQSMLALMQQSEAASAGQKGFSYAHPLFWAPYALIGDSGAH